MPTTYPGKDVRFKAPLVKAEYEPFGPSGAPALGSDAMRKEFQMDFDKCTYVNQGSYGASPRRIFEYR